jgi:hypothetical protein
LTFLTGGCNHSGHTSDPRLVKIDEMLNGELPKGTSEDRVRFFLNTRGYRTLNTGEPHTVVAIIRHIDTDTLRPQTARAIFRFDAHDHLDSYELTPAPEEAAQP